MGLGGWISRPGLGQREGKDCQGFRQYGGGVGWAQSSSSSSSSSSRQQQQQLVHCPVTFNAAAAASSLESGGQGYGQDGLRRSAPKFGALAWPDAMLCSAVECNASCFTVLVAVFRRVVVVVKEERCDGQAGRTGRPRVSDDTTAYNATVVAEIGGQRICKYVNYCRLCVLDSRLDTMNSLAIDT
ncbi:hypothetical protein AXG93_4368s1820 [Marchantia polymorpha subsp. ruderalis]|uniref:Uncharacterized protein n=1 Tax=Marchantia polymorpha subsp. ruderalis TaxID=1480154 RepID=A0A176VZS2_MARPO|nr:hypothetical protein AXG93_4368s1820 [Marchantia polymorpha subsp. ruderalis]